jgi:hypothetical protein
MHNRILTIFMSKNLHMNTVLCEERSDAAIQHLYAPGLLHYVTKDE